MRGIAGSQARRYLHRMSRTAIATLAGIFGLTAYLIAVLVIGDHVQTLHWAIQAVFYTIAGLVWVLPIRSLMYWSVGKSSARK